MLERQEGRKNNNSDWQSRFGHAVDVPNTLMQQQHQKQPKACKVSLKTLDRKIPEHVLWLHKQACPTEWKDRVEHAPNTEEVGTGLWRGSPAQGPKNRTQRCIHSLAQLQGTRKCTPCDHRRKCRARTLKQCGAYRGCQTTTASPKHLHYSIILTPA